MSRPFEPESPTPGSSPETGCAVVFAMWVSLIVTVAIWVEHGWLWAVTFAVVVLTLAAGWAYLAERAERRNRR